MSIIQKINDFLAGWTMTLVGGVFLAASFILPRMGWPACEKLAWVCVIICGLPLLYLAVWRLFFNKGISKISSCLLISMAMIAAICIGDLFAAGEVAFIMEIGALLEDMTTERAKKGLKKLISLAPETGRVLRGGREEIVPITEVKEQDLLRILPGETIPVDGIITGGETSIDQSVMTGESLPVDKSVGDHVFSGTLNRFGSIDIRAEKTGQDSSLQKLIRMVEDAEKNQAPTQRIADKWASRLVPIALLIAIAAYFFTGNIVRAVTVMVVFCPCALVLATPTAIMAAIGQATKHGVIIKSGEALELMGKVNTIAFDKTGTLTSGRIEVSDLIPLPGKEEFKSISKQELLILAASAESRSEHPLGKAITEKARSEGLTLREITDFKMTAGRGISARIDGTLYFFGNETYIREALRAVSKNNQKETPFRPNTIVQELQNHTQNLEIPGKLNHAQVPEILKQQNLTLASEIPGQVDHAQIPEILKQQDSTSASEILEQLRAEGKASVLVSTEERIIGIIALSDVIRPESAGIVKRLNEMGTKTILLTGDNPKAARYLASQVPVSEVRADLLPEEKVDCISLLKKKGKVCMIGDGVNDAPALKTADVGVAMGAMGSDIAVEAADVALMNDDLSKLPYLKWLGDTTIKTIKTAITLSMCINFIAVTLSVLGVLNPTTGALVHNAGSTFVVLLAALLYDKKFTVYS